MIDVGVCQKNSCDRAVARSGVCRTAGLQLPRAFDLPRQIGGCVNQEPVLNPFGVAADSDAGLRLRRNFPNARGDTIGTGTVPLRQATAGCASENVDANQPELRGN